METRFVQSDGGRVAYRVTGESGPPLLYVRTWLSNLGLDDSLFHLSRYYARLSRFCRLIRFDKRGTGQSDREPVPSTPEEHIADMEAVLRAEGLDRVAVFGESLCAGLAVQFAAAHPEHVSHLILAGAMVCNATDPGVECAPPAVGPQVPAITEVNLEAVARLTAQSLAPEEADLRRAIVGYLLSSATPAAAATLLRLLSGMDVRALLSRVSAPTLVLHHTGDHMFPIEHGRYLASHIAGARLVEIEGNMHQFWKDDVPLAVVEVERFLNGSVQASATPVDVTVLAFEVAGRDEEGDTSDPADRLDAFAERVGRLIAEHGGKEAIAGQNSHVASFQSVEPALRAARAVLSAAEDLGLQASAGLDAGTAYEDDGFLFGGCAAAAGAAARSAPAGAIVVTEAILRAANGAGVAAEKVALRGALLPLFRLS